MYMFVIYEDVKSIDLQRALETTYIHSPERFHQCCATCFKTTKSTSCPRVCIRCFRMIRQINTYHLPTQH